MGRWRGGRQARRRRRRFLAESQVSGRGARASSSRLGRRRLHVQLQRWHRVTARAHLVAAAPRGRLDGCGGSCGESSRARSRPLRRRAAPERLLIRAAAARARRPRARARRPPSRARSAPCSNGGGGRRPRRARRGGRRHAALGRGRGVRGARARGRGRPRPRPRGGGRPRRAWRGRRGAPSIWPTPAARVIQPGRLADGPPTGRVGGRVPIALDRVVAPGRASRRAGAVERALDAALERLVCPKSSASRRAGVCAVPARGRPRTMPYAEKAYSTAARRPVSPDAAPASTSWSGMFMVVHVHAHRLADEHARHARPAAAAAAARSPPACKAEGAPAARPRRPRRATARSSESRNASMPRAPALVAASPSSSARGSAREAGEGFATPRARPRAGRRAVSCSTAAAPPGASSPSGKFSRSATSSSGLAVSTHTSEPPRNPGR